MIFYRTKASIVYIIFYVILSLHICGAKWKNKNKFDSDFNHTHETRNYSFNAISSSIWNNNNTVSSNTSNATMLPYTMEPPKKNNGWEAFIFATNSIIFIVGVIGNLLIAITIIRQKNMRNLQNYFVFSLAITDIVTLVLILPWYLMSKYVSWPFGEFCCKYMLPIGDVLPPVSILMLVAISIDRYRAIIHTLSLTPSLRAGIVLIVAIWVASYMMVGFPLTFTFQVGPGYWVSKSCYTYWTSAQAARIYFILRTILFYIIPSIVVFVCYIRVTASLSNSLKFIARSMTADAQVKRLQHQKRVMNMFFAIFLTFFLCFLPVNLISIISVSSTHISRWEYATELFQFTAIFVTANSTCNPIILYHYSRAYRNSFQRYLPFLKYCCQHPFQKSKLVNITDEIRIENTSFQLHMPRSQQIHSSFRT